MSSRAEKRRTLFDLQSYIMSKFLEGQDKHMPVKQIASMFFRDCERSVSSRQVADVLRDNGFSVSSTPRGLVAKNIESVVLPTDIYPVKVFFKADEMTKLKDIAFNTGHPNEAAYVRDTVLNIVNNIDTAENLKLWQERMVGLSKLPSNDKFDELSKVNLDRVTELLHHNYRKSHRMKDKVKVMDLRREIALQLDLDFSTQQLRVILDCIDVFTSVRSVGVCAIGFTRKEKKDE